MMKLNKSSCLDDTGIDIGQEVLFYAFITCNVKLCTLQLVDAPMGRAVLNVAKKERVAVSETDSTAGM